jgi:transcriptional regulator with XRE-family HTH domain
MDEKQIGLHIKKLRIQQKITQQEIADYCGFSKSLLSKIEHGATVPPLGTLIKIATSLHTTLSTLVGEDMNSDTAYDSSSKAESQLFKTSKGYTMFPFASENVSKKMQPILYVVKKDKLKSHFSAHAGEEFYYILSGEMKLRIGNTIHHLRPGDGIYFNSSNEHETIPITDEVRLLNIVTE